VSRTTQKRSNKFFIDKKANEEQQDKHTIKKLNTGRQNKNNVSEWHRMLLLQTFQ
jgi:hypothetical protein